MNAVLDAALRRWQLHGAGASGPSMLERIAQGAGTPLYLYSRPLIAARIAALRAELPDDLALLYAVKANPDPAVVGCVVPLADGCDVTSAAEIAVALRAGAAGRGLSVAGPGKSDDELAAAVAANALVVVESPNEARRLAAFAAGGVRPRVALRINPPFPLAADARMGGGARRFGVDSEQAPQALAEIGRLPLAFEGFHVFAGSGCLDALAIVRAQQATLKLACELAPFAPAPVRVLNLGGGFGVPCFPGDAPFALATVGAALRALAAEAARRLPGARLALELGRYLVAEAGLYLTRVVDRKESRGRVFLIVDGGANHHWHATGALEGRRHLHFPLTVVGGEGRPVELVTVCGPLCAPHDTWAEEIALPVAVPGDLVAVFQSGAYGASASPQAFLGNRPARAAHRPQTGSRRPNMLEERNADGAWAPTPSIDDARESPKSPKVGRAPEAAKLPKAAKPAASSRKSAAGRPTRREAEVAVRTLLRWAGDDPGREGLRDTPARVARAFEEFFAGYAIDPAALLARTFEEVEGYDEMIVLRDVRVESYCEHHMVPIIGRAHVAYLPRRRVVGISKLARLVDAYAKRLQIQEKLTVQIADTLQDALQPKGVAVVIEATHQCMTTRGVHKPGVAMITSRMLGAFRDDANTRREFFALVGGNGSHTASGG